MILPVSNGALIAAFVVLIIFLPLYLVFKIAARNVESGQRNRAELNDTNLLTAINETENDKLARKAVEMARARTLPNAPESSDAAVTPSEPAKR